MLEINNFHHEKLINKHWYKKNMFSILKFLIKKNANSIQTKFSYLIGWKHILQKECMIVELYCIRL